MRISDWSSDVCSSDLILTLAANTAFADFPRVTSIIAADGYLPRQLSNRGDRLVFSNGIVVLALVAALLIVAFGGETTALIPLYAVRSEERRVGKACVSTFIFWLSP